MTLHGIQKIATVDEDTPKHIHMKQNLRIPRIVLVGNRCSGKSALIANISGVSTGRRTICPIEWHIGPSDAWSASVSIAHRFLINSTPTTRANILLDGACSNATELSQLLKKAEVIACSSDEKIHKVLLMDNFELEDLYFSIILSSRHNTSNRTGVVCIDLKCPWVKNALTIVDLPGLTATGYVEDIQSLNDLVRSYVQEKDCIVTMVSRSCESENEVLSLPLLKRIPGFQLQDAYLVLTNVDPVEGEPTKVKERWLSILTGKLRRPYRSFTVLVSHFDPKENGLTDMLAISQEEGGYFLFRDPWARYRRDMFNFGLSKLTKDWEREWTRKQQLLMINNDNQEAPSLSCSTRLSDPFTKIFIFLSIFTLLALIL